MAKTKVVKKYKKANIGLIIALSIVSGLFVLTGVLYGISMARVNSLSYSLENIYQKNYYELVDNINNTEVKLSKVLASGDSAYSKKLLAEISKSSSRASANLSALPISINGLSDTITFINKADGYTTSLVKKLEGGDSLTASERETLSKMHDSVVEIKSGLSKITNKLYGGYSILDESLSFSGDYNGFTTAVGGVSTDIDYPSMIYDGPFSDSVVSQEVLGLNYDEVSKEEAQQKLIDILETVTADKIEYQGETDGRIVTYDFSINTGEDNYSFYQLTKKGGKLLNISSFTSNISTTNSLSTAITNATKFIEKTGVQNMQCVWSDIVNGTAFLNFAPVINNTIIYPELIKVKVELGEGKVTGFDATTYYTNHKERQIATASFGAVSAREKVSSEFNIVKQKLALIPLEWNTESLCHEFECTKDGATYYIYISATTGAEENILKVVETNSGNLLM